MGNLEPFLAVMPSLPADPERSGTRLSPAPAAHAFAGAQGLGPKKSNLKPQALNPNNLINPKP